MRIVPSLKEVKKCLNCGSDNLHNCRNDKGTEYIFCGYCHEYVYESESTKSAPSKEEVLFELREMAEVLPHYAHDANTTFLMQMIRDIFHKLIDYIEEN
jgi:hypothetical protein